LFDKDFEDIDCSECDHPDLVRDNGALICRYCGMILSEDRLVDQSRRMYTQEDIIIKQQNNLVDDKFSSRRTVFNANYTNVNIIDMGKFKRMERVDKWSIRTDSKALEVKNKILNYYDERNFRDSKTLIKKIDYILQKTITYNLQGKNKDWFTAAVLIYILRSSKIPCKIKDICLFYNIGKNKLMKVMMMMNDIIESCSLSKLDELRLRDYVGWYIYKVANGSISDNDLSTIRTNAIYYADIFEKYNNCKGNSTTCNAAGIIYFVLKKSGYSKKQNTVSTILNVTEVSLRRAVNDLKEILESEKPEEE